MKKALLLIVSFLITGFAQAQSDIEEVKVFQSLFGAEKKAIITPFIKLRSPAKETFWTLYDQYEAQRQELGLIRLDLLKKYADTYGTINDATTNQLMSQMISLQKKNDKLILTYYNKIKKAVGAKPAAQFYQLEGYFLSSIRTAVLEAIPMIGELEARTN